MLKLRKFVNWLRWSKGYGSKSYLFCFDRFRRGGKLKNTIISTWWPYKRGHRSCHTILKRQNLKLSYYIVEISSTHLNVLRFREFVISVSGVYLFLVPFFTGTSSSVRGWNLHYRGVGITLDVEISETALKAEEYFWWMSMPHCFQVVLLLWGPALCDKIYGQNTLWWRGEAYYYYLLWSAAAHVFSNIKWEWVCNFISSLN